MVVITSIAKNLRRIRILQEMPAFDRSNNCEACDDKSRTRIFDYHGWRHRNYGSWQPLVEWLRNTVREKHGIDDVDLQCFRMMDAPNEIAEWFDRAIDDNRPESS